MISGERKISSCCQRIQWVKGQPSIIVSHLWVSVSGSVTRLIATVLACLQWTGAHQLAWVTMSEDWLLHDTQRRILAGTTLSRLTQIATHTPKQSLAGFQSFSSTNIMNMNNPLALTLPACAILFSIQALKMSRQRQKGKLRKIDFSFFLFVQLAVAISCERKKKNTSWHCLNAPVAYAINIPVVHSKVCNSKGRLDRRQFRILDGAETSSRCFRIQFPGRYCSNWCGDINWSIPDDSFSLNQYWFP